MLFIVMLALPWLTAGLYSFDLTAKIGRKKFNDPDYPGVPFMLVILPLHTIMGPFGFLAYFLMKRSVNGRS